MEIHKPKRMKFTSFDESTSIETTFEKPIKTNFFEKQNIDLQIPRGGGWSYAPASFGKNILVTDMTLFNKILEFEMALKLPEPMKSTTVSTFRSVLENSLKLKKT